jgi:hypothetical protein
MPIKSFGDDQTARMRASIGSVFYRKGSFDNWAENKVNKLCNKISFVIDHYLEEIGQAVSERARQILEESSPGGGAHYLIVDESGIILRQWDASAAGDPPASITGLLKRSIEYKIGSGGDRADFVEIGVWSDEEWEYQTLRFIPAKKGESIENETDRYGKIVVGEGGHTHPVKLYAHAMEHGFVNKRYGSVAPRPFLKPAFEEIVLEGRKTLQREMKQAFADSFKEKVPVTFRIYLGKEYQKKGY